MCDATIQRLIKEKGRINFNSVSMESSVSKAYLYNNQGIREKLKHCASSKKAYLHQNREKSK